MPNTPQSSHPKFQMFFCLSFRSIYSRRNVQNHRFSRFFMWFSMFCPSYLYHWTSSPHQFPNLVRDFAIGLHRFSMVFPFISILLTCWAPIRLQQPTEHPWATAPKRTRQKKCKCLGCQFVLQNFHCFEENLKLILRDRNPKLTFGFAMVWTNIKVPLS